jgi:hypothetical protein
MLAQICYAKVEGGLSVPGCVTTCVTASIFLTRCKTLFHITRDRGFVMQSPKSFIATDGILDIADRAPSSELSQQQPQIFFGGTMRGTNCG